jgi:hypothetical protein
MSHKLRIALLLLMSLPVLAANVIPTDLKGVWATDESVMEGDWLLEGLSVVC